ncbi:hypothetical protein L2X98_22605 [Microbacterium elymi]|uniref:Uncharacterized protein n=1 Tax=Microbacterium elymi TaxID=2909587 RepID=A0ABY5NLC7_9MICO|nr:hypothetical protein [Microbacterium elymi]UUT35934.1 hypothetical protein L2X98_22605 [Microbacterium elymi]
MFSSVSSAPGELPSSSRSRVRERREHGERLGHAAGVGERPHPARVQGLVVRAGDGERGERRGSVIGPAARAQRIGTGCLGPGAQGGRGIPHRV